MKKKFLFSAFGWFMTMVIGQIIGAIIGIIYQAATVPNWLEMLMTEEDIMKVVSGITNPMLLGGVIAVFVVVLIAASKIDNEEKTYGQKLKDYLNLHPLENPFSYVSYFCMGIGINIILSLALTWIYELLNLTDDATMFSQDVLMIVCVALLVPIAEEIVYRNRIYINFKNIKHKSANFWQSLLFGLSHGMPIQVLYTFGFGLVFGKINDREKSLLPSICLHCGINFFAAIAMFSPGAEMYLIPFTLLAIPQVIKLLKRERTDLDL